MFCLTNFIFYVDKSLIIGYNVTEGVLRANFKSFLFAMTFTPFILSFKEFSMYTKNKSQRITLRLSEEQFAFVRKTSDFIGVSPSDFLRMVINSAMSSEKILAERNGAGRENDKTNLNDIV